MDFNSFSTGSSWSWPEDPLLASRRARVDHEKPEAAQDTAEDQNGHNTASSEPEAESQVPPEPEPEPTRHYPPRTCRICLETVLPTYQPPSTDIPGFLRSRPSVTYVSDDPSTGRLIRPCECKGSSQYVHEGCLQMWRHADPSYGKRNYWQCPTCGFRYRLERMAWGRWVASPATQVSLTVVIFLLAMFILGFVADPIINFYLDPYGSLTSMPIGRFDDQFDERFDEELVTSSWGEHLLKGLASLGLLSFVKVLFAMSPWQWWNLRSSGLMGGGSGRGANSGRDRLASISWIVVVIGIGTFLWGAYKGVRAWSRRTLEKAGERVMDVQGEDEDVDEDTPQQQAM